VPAVALLIGVHLLSGDSARQETGRRIVDALLWSTVLRKPLQRLIRSPRPEPYEYDDHAFPSGHATAAFSVASAWSQCEPSAAPFAYAAAAAVGWSRHELGMHTWEQVAGGAALGAYVGDRCGDGEWTTFGHSDADLAAPAARLASAPAPCPMDDPFPRHPTGKPGFEMRLTLWSTRF
jgi:hypothetical protein